MAFQVITWINFSIDLDNPGLQLLKSLTESSTEEDLGYPNGWASLQPLWKDPYWKRVWIQQEILLAVSWKV